MQQCRCLEAFKCLFYEHLRAFLALNIQFLKQLGQNGTVCVLAFQRCNYEYQDLGFAYYAGIKRDNWNKRAIDFTIEGNIADITTLKNIKSKLRSAVEKAIKPDEAAKHIRLKCQILKR